MTSEQSTIDAVLAGNSGAFRVLVETHQGLVFQFCRNMLPSKEDAEDLTQDVFVAAFQNLATFDANRARLSTWLLTIARNLCLNRLKRRSWNLPGQVEPVDPSPLPHESLVQDEVWRQLSCALETLPVEQRTAFVLAEIQELPHAEIAEIEGVELGTVKSRVSRARERLRQALKDWQSAPEQTSRRQT